MNLTREIKPDEFELVEKESPIHGRGHIHRVMFWADKICTTHGFKDIRGDVLAAARLHDLARKGDGVCHLHGAAAAELIPKYESFLRETFGMKNPDAVAYACSIHCLPGPLDPDHPYYYTAAALKDADALDRFRLGPHEGPDPARINLQRSMHFANAARELALATTNETPLEEIERLGRKFSNPAENARLSCPDSPAIEEAPRQRRNRRLRQSQFYAALKETLDDLETNPILKEAAKLGTKLSIPERRSLVQGMKDAVMFIKEFRAITYFPEHGYEKFLEEKTTKCIWETGPTWHTRYVESAEDALDAKAYNDQRLWGEKAKPITYGSLIPAGEGGDFIHEQLQKMYGPKFVEWDFSKVAEHSSFCINDSQETHFCLPCDAFHETILRQLVAGMSKHHQWAAVLTKICPFPELLRKHQFHFVEIQIHRAMTPSDKKQPQP